MTAAAQFPALLNPTRRGIFTIPFRDYWKFQAVNNSLLTHFNDCPLSAFEFLAGLVDDKPTRPMILGSAVDCLLCDRELFGASFHIRPDELEDEKWQGNRKVCRAWLASHSDRPVLTVADVSEAEAIAAAVSADPRASDLLQSASVQQSVFWTDKRSGLQMKGRPDFKLNRTAADLKVVSDASTDGFSRQIESMRWHVQAAIYSDGLEAVGEECNTFYFVAVQSGDRPKVNVRALKSDAIELGRATYQKQLWELKACLTSGVWPGYGGPGVDIGEIDLPRYAYQREETELVIGGKVVNY